MKRDLSSSGFSGAMYSGHGQADGGPYSEFYREFIEFVGTDIQRERKIVNQQMFSVFLWSFIIPMLVAGTLVVLVKAGVLPRSANRYLDLIVVFFPVAYGLYMLSFDAAREIPVAFKKGGIAAALSRALVEERWRARVCGEMQRRFLSEENPRPEDAWRWVVQNFKTDLDRMQSRTKYVTALAGAVFFLIFDGIDALDVSRHELVWSASSIMGWIESSTNHLAQFVGLGIFLMLLYVSGNQIYQSLARYLECAVLVSPGFFRRRPE